MAVTMLMDSQLRLTYENGMDEKGNVLMKRKNYSNIKLTATPDQLLTAAQAIASLQTQSLLLVERNDTNQINA